MPATGRTADGRFAPGTSGNPGGRPRVPDEVRQALEARTERAVARLAQLMDSPDDAVACRACVAILDRVCGTPRQSLELTGPAGGPVETSQVQPTREQLVTAFRELAQLGILADLSERLMALAPAPLQAAPLAPSPALVGGSE